MMKKNKPIRLRKHKSTCIMAIFQLILIYVDFILQHNNTGYFYFLFHVNFLELRIPKKSKVQQC